MKVDVKGEFELCKVTQSPSLQWLKPLMRGLLCVTGSRLLLEKPGRPLMRRCLQGTGSVSDKPDALILLNWHQKVRVTMDNLLSLD